MLYYFKIWREKMNNKEQKIIIDLYKKEIHNYYFMYKYFNTKDNSIILAIDLLINKLNIKIDTQKIANNIYLEYTDNTKLKDILKTLESNNIKVNITNNKSVKKALKELHKINYIDFSRIGG
jgi:hypothetical protein